MPEAEARRPRVLHVADLSGIGGVEQKIRFYLKESGGLGRFVHHLLVIGRRIHPGLAPDIHLAAASVSYGKYRGPLKLPKWPNWLRSHCFAQRVKEAKPDVIMVWNRFGDVGLMQGLRASSSAPIVHCECGSAWYEKSERRAAAYLEHVASVVCAAHACRRVLELRWGWNGSVAAEVNGLRPDCRTQTAVARRIGKGSRVKLGVAARVSPRKGISLAVHALAQLRAAGYDAELHVAGNVAGEAGEAVKQTIAELHLEPYVTLHGIVRDMASFFGMIDVFLCPSLREPFGSVCVEAAALGCVVVATRIDGLVEAVHDGVTGYCILPELPVEDYPRYGGTLAGLPEFAYDPEVDAIVKLRIPDPGTIATTIAGIIDDPEACATMSAAGIRRANVDLHFDHFVAALDSAFAGALAAAGTKED